MPAYAIYSAYLGELRASVDFCRISAQLRPRLNDYVRWEIADGPAKIMFQQFMQGQPKEVLIYQSSVVSLHSGFEQFVLDLVDDAAAAMSSRSLDFNAFENKFPGVIKHSCAASGHALASIFEPRSHWKVDYEELISRLATARAGSNKVEVYGRPFGVRKASLSCDEIDKLMGRLGFTVPWTEISKDVALQKALGVSGKASAETSLRSKIARVLDLRNNLAHSQGAEVVTYEQVVQFIEVYDRFSELLASSLLEFVAT